MAASEYGWNMPVNQELAWAEAVNSDETVLLAPHQKLDADQELAQPAGLLINLDMEEVEEGDSVEEVSNSETVEEEGNPEGDDSDWDIDVMSNDYENINKRADRRHVAQVTFKVLKPGQDRIGVTDTREKKAKNKELAGEEQQIDEHPWEARLWVNNVKLGERKKNGLQIFLGNYKTEKQAQDVHDRAAIYFKKTGAHGEEYYTLNFPASEQAQYMAYFRDWCVRDYLWYHRRHSDSFTRSKVGLKGVTERTSRGKTVFEAKISYTDTVKNEWLLGRFDTKEEAGRAYDLALLYCHRYEGAAKMIEHVITNHRPSQYTNAQIREAGRKLIPKPKSRREVSELQSKMNKKMRT